MSDSHDSHVTWQEGNLLENDDDDDDLQIQNIAGHHTQVLHFFLPTMTVTMIAPAGLWCRGFLALLLCLGVSSFTITSYVHQRPRSVLRGSTETRESDVLQVDQSDSGFREMRETWPLWLQNGLRDTGALRIIMNSLTRYAAAPVFYYKNPRCLPEFVRISGYPQLITNLIAPEKSRIHFSIESYGPHPSQYAEVMVSDSEKDCKDLPLLIFVHGGAWGSGFPTMYRLISVPFLEKGYRVAVLGYRTYPDANTDGQVDDVVRAVDYLTRDQHGPTVLMAHSSGAHLSLLAALRGSLPSSSIDALICKSGVYDIEEHFEHECSRGVDQISPMSPACGPTLDDWRRNSPLRVVETVEQSVVDALPPLLFVHGETDGTVSPSVSVKCFEAVTARGKGQCDLRILEGIGHSEPVLETLLGGPTQDTIFEWLDSLGLKVFR